MSTETETPSRIKTTWLIGILAAFAIFAVIAHYSGHMTRAYPGYEQQRAADRYVTLQKVRADEDKIINGPADWIDQSKGIIHIPIDEAMAKEVDTLKAESAHICAEVMAGAPAPAPAAAPTTPAVGSPAPAITAPAAATPTPTTTAKATPATHTDKKVAPTTHAKTY